MALLSITRWTKLWPVFALMGVATLAYFKGHSNGKAKAQLVCLQEKQQAFARAIQQAEETTQAHRQIADTFHKKQERAKVKTQIIEKEVIRYVDKHRNNDGCHLDAEGVRLINDLINIANSESTQD